MYKKNMISSIIFIILGGLFMKPSLDLGLSSTTSDGVPGAGFFPFFMGLGIVILGVILFITAFIQLKKLTEPQEKTVANRENVRNAIVMMFIILVYILLWKLVGYYIATFIAAFSINWYFKRSWIFTIGFSAVFVLLIYAIFTAGLKIQFVM